MHERLLDCIFGMLLIFCPSKQATRRSSEFSARFGETANESELGLSRWK